MSEKLKEKRFLDALGSLFTGAEVDGDSGYINLMRIKREYFKSTRQLLLEKINDRTRGEADFREELFDKLHTFFDRYFCESGSIYFRHLSTFSKTYERVYEDGEDVALAWKTRMLYYVKSDVLVQSMPVKIQDEMSHVSCTLFFDASAIEHRQNNERREFIFEFSGIEKTAKKKVICLAVRYSENGTKTNLADIVKQAKKASNSVRLTDKYLRQAIQVFKRQTEADFFIHKDARGFLREQFDLWLYQYLFQEETVFGQHRLDQLQAIQHTAYDIIDFIAQFEDELRRIWEKPKFVRDVNYVVTLDKLPTELLKQVTRHKGAKAQIREWRELNLVGRDFSMATLNQGQRWLEENVHGPTNGDYRFLPLDTRHFKEMELEILDALGNLDEVLDGELICGDNWQALNTLQKRYQNRIKCIYIDPPFNLGDSDMFLYRTNYKDACWITMLANRLVIARDFMVEGGSIFIRVGHDGNHLVRFLMNTIFGQENYRNEIIVRRAEKQKGELMKQFESMRAMMVNYDNLYWYSVNSEARFNFITKPSNKQQKLSQWHSFWKAEDRPNLRYKIFNVALDRGQWMWEKNRTFRAISNYEDYLRESKKRKISLEKYWEEKTEIYYKETGQKLEFVRQTEGTDISSIQYWMPPRESVISDNNWTDIKGYDNTTGFKTENSESLVRRIAQLTDDRDVLLDFFAGSGTTQSVAHKLGRRWIGVEMGEHFYTIVLPRMKKVLSGHQLGISKEVAHEGGGAFKYYRMEQYEEVLKNSHYQGGTQLELDSAKPPFEQYVFFGDDKLAYAVTAQKNKKLKIHLKGLYPDIDIAESISNILGKPIRCRTADEVTFADGSTEKINPKTMSEEEKLRFVGLIKPYLWWGKNESA